MSLFERLKNKRYDLTEVSDDFTSKQRKDNLKMLNKMFGSTERSKKTARDVKKTVNTSNKKENKRQKKIISKNKAQGDKLLQDINKRKSADLTRADAINRSMDSYDDGDLGNPNQSKSSTATKTKTVKQSEVSKQAKEFTQKINKKRTRGFENVTGEGKVKYPKTKKELIAKRKEYGINRKGNISKTGVEKYARNIKQSNLPLTQQDLDKAKQFAVGGKEVKDSKGNVVGKTTGKYGGKLGRARNKNMPSYDEVKAKIDAKEKAFKKQKRIGKYIKRAPQNVAFKQTATKFASQVPGGKSTAVKKVIKGLSKIGPAGRIAAATGLVLLNPGARKLATNIGRTALGFTGGGGKTPVKQQTTRMGINLSPGSNTASSKYSLKRQELLSKNPNKVTNKNLA